MTTTLSIPSILAMSELPMALVAVTETRNGPHVSGYRSKVRGRH